MDNEQINLPLFDRPKGPENPEFLPDELERILINLIQNFHRGEFALIRMSSTMLKKSIIDASGHLRSILLNEGVVDFGQVASGEKIMARACVLTADGIKENEVSYYRPETKNGDPRFWIYSFKKFISSGVLVYFTAVDGALIAIPLTEEIVKEFTLKRAFKATALNSEILKDLASKVSTVKSRGWIKSISPNKLNPKDVGLTLERELGISANVDKEADFMGIIEIKSRLRKASNKGTLFAQSPQWDISRCKSAGEIMLTYGYTSTKHPGHVDLYVTVNNKPNNQGLYLEPRDGESLLYQLHSDGTERRDVCCWEYNLLRHRLYKKHPATIWVDAIKDLINGEFHFQYVSAELTQTPIFTQFTYLISQGIVTYDWRGHVKPDRTGYRDHGHCFRINPRDKHLLFGQTTSLDI